MCTNKTPSLQKVNLSVRTQQEDFFFFGVLSLRTRILFYGSRYLPGLRLLDNIFGHLFNTWFYPVNTFYRRSFSILLQVEVLWVILSWCLDYHSGISDFSMVAPTSYCPSFIKHCSSVWYIFWAKNYIYVFQINCWHAGKTIFLCFWPKNIIYFWNIKCAFWLFKSIKSIWLTNYPVNFLCMNPPKVCMTLLKHQKQQVC